jgi:small subunit ribosomal protein S6
MRYYELLYIVNSNFEQKKIDEAMNEIDSRIKKTKSKIINHIIWGKKKLAYPIQGNNYGTYILVHYQGGDNNKLDEFDSWLKLSDLVIRHMVVRLTGEPDILEKVGSEKSNKVDKEPGGEEKISNDNKDGENKEVE